MGDQATTERPLNSYAIAAFVYVERDGKMLTLKRAGGAGTGLWAPPGGAKEHGEDPQQAAARELLEETGLVPTTPLELIAIAPLTGIYGMDWLHCFYACECAEGEVVINDEHSAFRWVDPIEYGRGRYGDEVAELLKDRPNDLANLDAFRTAFERYLNWRAHRQTCSVSR